MFGNPYAEKFALEATYEDTATVTRQRRQKGADGLARPVSVEVYNGIICALSKGGNSSRQTDAQLSIDYDMKLFVSPDIEIEPGDTISVARFGRIQTSNNFVQTFEVVGVPVRYLTHREVFLKAGDLS